MADNLDPQQIEDLNKNLEDLVKALGGTSDKSAGLTKSMGEQLGISKGVMKGLSGLGTSAADLTKNLYAGGKGAGTFGDAAEQAANALSLLILAIPGLGIAAKVAAVAINLFAKGVNAAAKQGDALYKTYQDLQKSGATASDGITGVFKSMQGFGYGIEELDKMVQLVSQNSESLAKFSTTAADGTRAFSNAMTDIVRDPELKLLGKTPEELNKAGAAFIRQQVAMGRSQKQIGDQLGSSTKQYVMDLDRLQRLTGTSAEALQKQQDALLDVDAYNVYMEGLEEQGDAGKAQAQKIKDITLMFPQLQKEIAGALAGNVEAAGKLNLIAPNLLNDLRDPMKTTSETVKTLGGELKGFKGTMGKNFGLDSTMRDLAGSYKDLNEAILTADNYDERAAAAKKNAVVTDDATKNLSKINLDQMNARDSLQSFVQLGVAPATRALAKMSGAASGLSSELPGVGAGNRPGFESKLEQLGGKTTSGTPSQTQKEFMDTMYNNLLDAAKKQGVKNPEVIAKLGVAQSALETGYGKHLAGGNNYFGIKGGNGPGVSTQEFENGRMVTKDQSFRKYSNMQESAADYVKFLSENKRYKGVLGANTLEDAISAQAKTGYATDPNYGSKLSSIASNVGTPGSGYRPNDLADPNKSLPLAGSSGTQQVQEQANQQNGLLAGILEKLDVLNRTNNDQLYVQQKTLRVAAN